MSEINKGRSTLDSINAQFQESTSKEQRRSKRRGSSSIKRMLTNIQGNFRKEYLFIPAVIVMISIIILLASGLMKGAKANDAESKTTLYQDILTKDEQKAWREKSADTSDLYIQVNTTITAKTGDKEAYLRLINPPYSQYTIQVKLTLNEESKELLYESGKLVPGSIEEYVTLNKALEAGEYPATLTYNFFDDKDNSLGEHLVSVSLSVK